MKKLYRASDPMVFGVCAGFGEYFNIDPTFVRLGFIFIWIVTGILPLSIAYLIATIIIPKKPKDYKMKSSYKKFYRSTTDRKIAGILGGIGEITRLDPAFLRLLTIFLCLITGVIPLVLAYIIGWIIIPERP